MLVVTPEELSNRSHTNGLDLPVPDRYNALFENSEQAKRLPSRPSREDQIVTVYAAAGVFQTVTIGQETDPIDELAELERGANCAAE